MKLSEYSSQVPAQVGPTPRLSIGTSKDTFGEVFSGKVAQATGETLSPIVEQQQKDRERLIQIQLINAESSLDAAWKVAVDDPNSGLKTKTGELARQAAPEVMKTIAKAHEDAMSKITLPHARELYEARARGTMNSYKSAINDYVIQQNKVALKAATKTSEVLGLSKIADNYRNDEVVADTLAKVETKLAALSHSEDGGASAGEKVADWYKAAGTVIIRNMLKEGTLAGIQDASKKIQMFRPVLGDHAATLEGEVKVAEQRVGGISAAISAFNGAKISNTSLIDDAKARKALFDDAKLDPITRLSAAEHLGQLISQSKIDQRNANEDRFSKIYSAYKKGGFFAINTEDIAYLRDQAEHQGTELWQRFTEIMRADSHWAENKPETEAERRAYGQFLAEFAAHKDEFAAMTMPDFQSKYHGNFNPRRRVEADTLVAGLKNPAQQTEGLSHNELQLVLSFGRKEGYFKETDPTQWSPDDTLRMMAITEDVSSKRTQWMQNHPKQKPDAATMHGWVKDWYQPNRVLGGTIYNSRVTRADAVLNPEAYRGKTIIPQKDLDQIDSVLRSLRISTDDVNRIWMYRRLREGAKPTYEDWRNKESGYVQPKVAGGAE